MTAEERLITVLADAIAAQGATLPIESALEAAAEGLRRESAQSAIEISVAVKDQFYAGVPVFKLEAAIDVRAFAADDPTGALATANCNAVYLALANLAIGGAAAAAFDDETDADAPIMCHFKFTEHESPSLSGDDEEGGSWSAQFKAEAAVQVAPAVQ